MADEEPQKQPDPQAEPEPQAEPQAEPKPASAEEIATKVAEAVTKAVAAQPGTKQPTAEQVEAYWQGREKATGLGRDQLLALDKERKEANERDNLPLHQRVGKQAAKEALGDHPELLDEVIAAMTQYAPNVQAQEQAWADMADLVYRKSERAGKIKKVVANDPDTHQEPPRRVMGGAGGRVNPGLSEGGGRSSPKKSNKQYSEYEQHVINKMFSGDAEAYEKYQTNESLAPRPVPGSNVQGGNAADVALAGLTKGIRE